MALKHDRHPRWMGRIGTCLFVSGRSFDFGVDLNEHAIVQHCDPGRSDNLFTIESQVR